VFFIVRRKNYRKINDLKKYRIDQEKI